MFETTNHQPAMFFYHQPAQRIKAPDPAWPVTSTRPGAGFTPVVPVVVPVEPSKTVQVQGVR